MTNKPQRKSTRLSHYDYSAHGAYFVTICTQNRQPILAQIRTPVGDGALDVPFGALDVPTIRLTEIGEVVKKYLLSSEKIPGVFIDSYVIMPDHIHAIIRLESSKIECQSGTSRAPSPTVSSAAVPTSRNQRTNEKLPHIISTFKRFCHQELGHTIFQRGYAEHVIRDDEDYNIRLRYINENPLRQYMK